MRQFINPVLSSEQCVYLTARVTPEDIKRVMFQLKDGKAPGPDGYLAEFFKLNWNVVGNDVIAAIQYCFTFMYYQLHSTVLTLVPKVENAMHMKNFKPIACCNHGSKSRPTPRRLGRVVTVSTPTDTIP
ncbi:unnamed protein product [Coffea canephora]|uniref:Reverse transcriptase domain-containing protein n=1 Tax=Coffea canephora TaxID=49390 RepID=A0A068UY01_COFCA|nr:unnamed protein product [Coffea canephora]